jgi:basic membrane protein A and related proteins
LKSKLGYILLLLITIVAGCSSSATQEDKQQEQSIGILLSDTGLGDDSFNDSAFRGLEKARDELGIMFDYREAPDGDFEGAFAELVKQKHDLIIGLGFSVQEALEKTAKEYPKQKFLLIDGVSELDNVTSITFKDHEGSFLVGMVAAMTTKSNKLGFIAGQNAPVIKRFEKGFEQGAKYINPSITIFKENANNFGDAKLGAQIANKQIKKGADFLYHAAGFTGVGALQAAQQANIFAAGVDSDQYFVAEEAVVTSMVKKIDNAVFNIAKDLKETGEISESVYELGLKEDGVGLAPIRVVPLTVEEEKKIEEATEKIISGDISIKIQ